MKVIFCESCGDILAPHRKNFLERWCACGRHAVWWEDGTRGVIRVHDVQGPTVAGPGLGNTAVWILGIANDILVADEGLEKNPDFYKSVVETIPDSYLFKKMSSLIIRFRPGQTSDSAWADFPNSRPIPTKH